jgi:hypothetical protein
VESGVVLVLVLVLVVVEVGPVVDGSAAWAVAAAGNSQALTTRAARRAAPTAMRRPGRGHGAGRRLG